MSALYEKTQGTQIKISSAPATAETAATATYLDLACTLKEVQFTAGQKSDIDVTTLCSDETENVNGLPAQSEISLSGNFYRNAAQDALRSAYDNDRTYAFKVIFPTGNGYSFIAEVRQHTWSTATSGVVAATFSLRLKGKPIQINADGSLVFTTDLPSILSIDAGSGLTLSVSVAGGTAPYSYQWQKDGAVVSGQNSAAFNNSSVAAGDSGIYKCVVTDSVSSVITSTECTVTIN